MSTGLERLQAQIVAVVEAAAPPPNPLLQAERERMVALGMEPAPPPPIVPPDRRGVLARLAEASDAVAWVAASLVYGNQNRRLAGLCSVASADLAEIQQTGAPGRRDASVALRQDDSIAALTDPTTAIRTFGLDGVQPLPKTDRAGRPFRRFGSLPRRSSATSRAEEIFHFPIRNSPYVIDIWTDDGARTSRIRMLTADGNIWAELAFLWGLDNIPYLIDSPILATEPLGSQWAGLEPVTDAPPPELRVALDPDGRPYDVVPEPGVSVSTRSLGVLHASDGKVVVADGNALEVSLDTCRQETQIIDFGDTVDLGITVVTEDYVHGQSVLGVRLDRPGTTVHRWGSFEPAYGTDGGVGGITTNDVLVEAERRGDSSLSDALSELTQSGDYDYGEPVVTSLLGISFADTIYFFNGVGDGGFPMTRGFDDREELVSLYVLDTRYPFRLAIPEGIPPQDVRAREDQFIECMQGRRPIMPSGDCPTDEQLNDPRIWP